VSVYDELARLGSATVYEGGGHLFFWQEPERFVRELEEFLL